jgi:serine/threonine-protein kinase SRPK3
VHDKYDDHLAQMFEMLGKFPTEWLQSGKMSSQFFDAKGNMLRVKESEFCPL